ncbi:MAG TPA: manganese transporter permease [Bdellovibrionota bacterium]|nr:manganese transporter permease [Bdellovibrionota bacterium]
MQTSSRASGQAIAWWQFIRERFDPVSHLLMIGLFFVAHLVLARSVYLEPLNRGSLFALFVGTLAFFFKLRLYDEIKDFQVDKKFNPTRPLARGLLNHRDLYWAIALCIVIELVAFGLQGMAALISISFAIGYSLLMYREFFIGRYLRPLLTTYAISHTVVSVFLSVALFSALTGDAAWALRKQLAYFALNSWCLFNVFEFGRKTFASREERDQVQSYSKIFGRFGAVFLVLTMATGSAWLLFAMELPGRNCLRALLGLLGGLLALSGLAYAILDRKPFGGVYRGISSLYIVLVYLGLVAVWSYPCS